VLKAPWFCTVLINAHAEFLKESLCEELDQVFDGQLVTLGKPKYETLIRKRGERIF
jgi:hypothetical protein